eukprot:COSAG02_NODE_648_length_18943_cov_924.526746_11_plen_76_part_00
MLEADPGLEKSEKPTTDAFAGDPLHRVILLQEFDGAFVRARMTTTAHPHANVERKNRKRMTRWNGTKGARKRNVG